MGQPEHRPDKIGMPFATPAAVRASRKQPWWRESQMSELKDHQRQRQLMLAPTGGSLPDYPDAMSFEDPNAAH